MSVAISVIMPFHNAESTIERALRSLQSQTMNDCEFVLVNDGSTDRSVEIIRDFAMLNPSFGDKLLLLGYPFRRGVAGANDVGISNANGRYIVRCDSDDRMMPEALQRLYDATDKERIDVVCAPMRITKRSFLGKRILRPKIDKNTLNDMSITTVNFSLCNKLIRTKLLSDNDIKPFPHIDCWEDVSIFARIMALNPSFSIIDTPTYEYFNDTPTSLTHRSNEMRLRDHLMCALLLEQWFVDNDKALHFDKFLTRLKYCAKIKYLRGAYKDVEKWKSTFPEVNKHILHISKIPLLVRIATYLISILPTSITQGISDAASIFYSSKYKTVK